MPHVQCVSLCNDVVCLNNNDFKAVAACRVSLLMNLIGKHLKPSHPRLVFLEESLVGAPVVSGVCQVARFRAGHRCLEVLLTKGLLGFLSSCCFCDLLWFLVSQKALFLGFVAAFSLAL